MLADRTEFSTTILETDEKDNTLALLLLIAVVFAFAAVAVAAGCTLVLKGSLVVYDILDFSVTSTVLAIIYQQLFA